MPAHKLRSQKLQCPFCSTISTRGTGLSAHVRAQHAREYGKWNKNPNRLPEAAAAASPQQEPRRNRSLHAVRSPAPVEVRKAAVSAQPPKEQPLGSGTIPTSPLEYLDVAITGLRSKQESVRADIQRLTGLEAEEADITRQLEALTKARAAFVPAETT